MNEYRVVDAFTERPGGGNPAAVLLLDTSYTDSWAQLVAAEFNLSETAFARRLPADADADYELRWFTPTVEVALCGHATLATAHVLAEDGGSGPVRFTTRQSGVLTVRESAGMCWMDFPTNAPTEITPPAGLSRALGAEPRWTGTAATGDLLALLESEEVVRGMDPASTGQHTERGVIVTAPAQPGRPYAFVSRFFAPNAGIPEDPVTGSAHTVLAPFWARELGSTAFSGRQCSARGGTVFLELPEDAAGRVRIGGNAVTVATGQVHI